MSKVWRLALSFLNLTLATVWLAVLYYPSGNIKIIACDVGQGDAFIILKGKIQILVDGGPNKKVVDCLDKYIPFWDRNIELVILSHPQKDHFFGLIEVMKRYKVDYLLSSGLDSSSQEFGLLKMQVGGSGLKVINATKGMVIRLGLIYLDIIHPSKEFISENSISQDTNLVSNLNSATSNILGVFTSQEDPNNFSVVFLLNYKDFNALFTGDMPPRISDMVADSLFTKVQKPINYIKIPHHGSKNGLTRKLLEASQPAVAVISVGKNNSYGHPHQEIIDMLSEKKIKILRTDLMGDIIVESDGKEVFYSK